MASRPRCVKIASTTRQPIGAISVVISNGTWIHLKPTFAQIASKLQSPLKSVHEDK